MNPESIRQDLRELYDSVWRGLMDRVPKDAGVSLPLFIDPPHAYFSANLRLMIVGQETGGWGDLHGLAAGDPIKRCQQLHHDVVTNPKRLGDFHRAARKLQGLLAPDVPRGGFIWANLFPCAQRERRPTEAVAKELLKLRVLPMEVRILQPKAVVFFTGKTQPYQEALDTLFPGATYPPCAGVDPLLVCRVQHRDLRTDAFRTDHPGSLRWKGKWSVIEQLAALIRPSRSPARYPPKC